LINQGEEFQKKQAKSHSKKIWLKVSWGNLQNGHSQASISCEAKIQPILSLVGRMFRAIFQRRCLRRAWSFKLQSLCQVFEEKGEARPLNDLTTALIDLTEKRTVEEGAPKTIYQKP
jgi:hypothetical protein